jgi:16S rRNA (cytosine1402-N4)-methyltransferase
LSFHSGEDRRVKHHFRDGFRSGIYQEISPDVIRPTAKEISQNSRAAAAKLRWAIRS